MKLNKNEKIRLIYIFFLYIIYNFLMERFGYKIKFLTHFIFFIYIFVNFILGRLDFYAERFRLKDIFIKFGINFVFSFIIFVFFKDWSIFLTFFIIFIFQALFKLIVCSKYVKKKNVLIFGSNHIQNNVQEDLINNLDYNYIGYVSDNRNRITKYFLGKYNKMEDIIREKEINTLVIVKNIKGESFKKYLKRLFDLKINGLEILSYEEFNESIQKKIDINKIDEEWLLESNGFDILSNESQKNTKRALDLTIAFFLLVITLPLWVIAAIIIKLESPGPVIFKQVRIGENMKKFKVYKFRSMRMHDEKEYSKYAGENDSRITPFGKFMRKTRIDELPQLWNIVKGTMSFVGPRPEWDILGEEYEKSIPYYNLRHLIKPGITGWAQVMYPYGECLEDTRRKLEYDLYYLKHQNLILDVLIIMKTAKVVIFGRGK